MRGERCIAGSVWLRVNVWLGPDVINLLLAKVGTAIFHVMGRDASSSSTCPRLIDCNVKEHKMTHSCMH